MQVMADDDFLLDQAPQGAMATIAGTRTNFGPRPINTSSRAPLHQRHVAHFLCAIGMSNCAIYVPFIKPTATQHKVRRPLRRFFGGDWYAWTGNAHKGRRENSILSRYAILSE